MKKHNFFLNACSHRVTAILSRMVRKTVYTHILNFFKLIIQ